MNEDEVRGILGERIRWARTQLGLSLQGVLDRGGPSRGYQSEVETGKKFAVSMEVLAHWVQILGVNLPFVRGETGQVHLSPAASWASAPEVGAWLRDPTNQREWLGLSRLERHRRVVNLVANSRLYTPMVLAHCLGVDLQVLKEMGSGATAIPVAQVHGLEVIVGLPKGALLDDTGIELESYREPVMLAIRKGISPERLNQLIKAEE